MTKDTHPLYVALLGTDKSLMGSVVARSEITDLAMMCNIDRSDRSTCDKLLDRIGEALAALHDMPQSQWAGYVETYERAYKNLGGKIESAR